MDNLGENMKNLKLFDENKEKNKDLYYSHLENEIGRLEEKLKEVLISLETFKRNEPFLFKQYFSSLYDISYIN